MNDAMAELLATCLERMEAGDSLESCLSDFPKQAAELEPLLRVTQQMKNLTNVEPRPAFAQNARLRLENQLATPEKAVTFKRQNRHIRQKPKILIQRRFNMGILQLIIAGALALAATTGGVAYAANASNPGDYLHGLDLAMENAQLNLAPDASSEVQLRIAFANERLAEAQATFSENDVADGLEAMNGYGAQISTIAQLVGSADGADKEALALLVETARGVHKDVLTNLLAKVPEQAKESIQKALDASNTPVGIPGLSPDSAGNPNGNGNPNGAGTSNGNGNSNGAGNSNGNGNPNGVGNPNCAGNPNGNGTGNSNGNPNCTGTPPANIPAGPPTNTHGKP